MTNDKNTDKQMPELPEFIQLEILKLAKPKKLSPFDKYNWIEAKFKEIILKYFKAENSTPINYVEGEGFFRFNDDYLEIEDEVINKINFLYGDFSTEFFENNEYLYDIRVLRLMSEDLSEDSSEGDFINDISVSFLIEKFFGRLLIDFLEEEIEVKYECETYGKVYSSKVKYDCPFCWTQFQLSETYECCKTCNSFITEKLGTETFEVKYNEIEYVNEIIVQGDNDKSFVFKRGNIQTYEPIILVSNQVVHLCLICGKDKVFNSENIYPAQGINIINNITQKEHYPVCQTCKEHGYNEFHLNRNTTDTITHTEEYNYVNEVNEVSILISLSFARGFSKINQMPIPYIRLRTDTFLPFGYYEFVNDEPKLIIFDYLDKHLMNIDTYPSLARFFERSMVIKTE